MKKILVMLAMLLLVLGIASAQDGELTISGMLETGVRVQAGNEYDYRWTNPHESSPGSGVIVKDHEEDKAYIDAYNDHATHNLRAQIQADYKTENSGVSIRFRVDADRKPRADGLADTLYLIDNGHAYGWFKFLPGGIAELSGGLLNNAKYGSYTDFYFDGNLDNRNFTKFVITPIEGLSLGVNLVNPKVGIADPEITMGHVLSGAVIGAEYKVPDLFGIRLAAMIGEKDAYAYANAPGGKGVLSQRHALGSPLEYFGTGSKSDFLMMWSGFFTGVENLRVDLEGALGVGKDAADESLSTFAIALMGNYQVMEPLWAGARVAFETQYEHEKNLAALEIRPQAGYTVNDWLAFELYIPIGLYGGEKDYNEDGGLGKATTYIGVQPRAVFTFNKNTKFTAWYDLGATTPHKDSGSDKTGIHHTVQLELQWKF